MSEAMIKNWLGQALRIITPVGSQCMCDLLLGLTGEARAAVHLRVIAPPPYCQGLATLSARRTPAKPGLKSPGRLSPALFRSLLGEHIPSSLLDSPSPSVGDDEAVLCSLLVRADEAVFLPG